MALHVDSTRSFRTPSEQEMLVRAVLAAEPQDESHWIEWKSPDDLTSTPMKFKIAKSILAFANRSPSVASMTAEGTAYLILGAAPGACPGVEVLDGAQLGQSLSPYVGGADGPRWSPTYVAIDGRSVLIITVEAPRSGDPLHVLCKAYDRFHAGAIFHRGTSHSEPASPGEIRMLQDRLVRGQREPTMSIEVHISMSPPGLCAIDNSERAIEEWLRQREESLEGLVPALPSRSGPSLYGPSFDKLAAFGSLSSTHFRRDIREHLDECRLALAHAAETALAAGDCNTLSAKVINSSDATIPNVELRLELDASSVRCYDDDNHQQLPEPPKPHDTFGLAGLQLSRISQLKVRSYDPNVPAAEVSNGRLVLTYRVGNVRPGRTVDCNDVTLLLSPAMSAAPYRVDGTWSATSTSRLGQASGAFSMAIANEALPLAIAGDPAAVDQ